MDPTDVREINGCIPVVEWTGERFEWLIRPAHNYEQRPCYRCGTTLWAKRPPDMIKDHPMLKAVQLVCSRCKQW